MLVRSRDVHVPALTPDELSGPPPPGLGPGADTAARSVPVARIVDWLALGGWAYELRAGGRAAVEAELQATLARWRMRGLPAEAERFDPVATLNFLKRAALSGQDDFWTRRLVPTARRLVWEHHAGPARDAPPSPLDLPPRNFAVRLSRTFHLAGIAPGTALRLRLPLPLEGPGLSGLVVRPHAGNGVALEVAPGRLEARLVADGAETIVLDAECHFVARPTPVADATEPMDAELYTRPGEGLIQVTPRVRALAAALADEDAAPRRVVRALWEHLLGHFRCGAVHYHEIPPSPPTDWVLDRQWYDCRLGAALLVALCRARFIPARLVGGHVLYEAAPFQHFWAEIWFADTGWTPFDLLGWDLSAGGRDRAWSDCFAGQVDYRIKTQVLPRLFTGPMTLRLPPRWHILARPEPDGLSTAITELESGRPIYTDRAAVRRGDQVPGDSVKARPL
jgi:hypothetical protein